jgi:ADP-heptose:LPS heptosyltransferase
VIAELMGVDLSDPTSDIFLTPEEEEFGRATTGALRTPIAIHIKSSTVNKEWPLKYWTELIARNPQYDFVQLGTFSEPRLEGTVNITEGDLRPQFAILKYCKAFVGVDSCFAHVTNAFNIPGVVLFGASNAEVWGHPNNVNLSTGIRCSPCIDMIQPFKCPYSVECLEMLAVEQVEAALKRQLSSPAMETGRR